jgi:hypothetical protein
VLWTKDGDIVRWPCSVQLHGSGHSQFSEFYTRKVMAFACRGALDFDDGVDTSRLLTHVADRLRAAKAQHVIISNESIAFHGGLFRFVGNWNVLVPFGYGELAVDQHRHEVRYRLSIGQLLAVATIMVLFLGAALLGAAKDGQNATPPALYLFLPFAWLCLVGGNIVLGVRRFERFLRESIDSTPTSYS